LAGTRHLYNKLFIAQTGRLRYITKDDRYIKVTYRSKPHKTIATWKEESQSEVCRGPYRKSGDRNCTWRDHIRPGPAVGRSRTCPNWNRWERSGNRPEPRSVGFSCRAFAFL